MNIGYLFSSPTGDIQLGPADLDRPFLVTPTRKHAFLTLADYFAAIKNLVLTDDGTPLLALLSARFNLKFRPDDINEIVIRSEKHGALYHIASVEILTARAPALKLAVTAAVTEHGRRCLSDEYQLLRYLNETFAVANLPAVYLLAGHACQVGVLTDNWVMVLGEWFDGYHEWHLEPDENQRQRLRLWDLQKGNRYLSDEAGFEIIRQAAKILTLCYDPHSLCQIWPWHHAAGDFVVKEEDGRIDVRLVTARGYAPLFTFPQEGRGRPPAALVSFLLILTIQMRLDRLAGVAEVVWLEDFAIAGTVKGFFDALQDQAARGQQAAGLAGELLFILQAFNGEDFQRLAETLLPFIDAEPEDLTMIQRQLPHHASRLARLIQQFQL